MKSDRCRQDNGPISELPTETELMARACHHYHPEICNEFDMQKLRIPLWRIKLWNFRSAPNVVIHILKNQVNLYDSNGVIAIPISTLGDKKWNLPFFLFTYFSSESLERIGLYVVGKIFSRRTQCRWNRGKWFRIDREIPETNFMNINLGGR